MSMRPFPPVKDAVDAADLAALEAHLRACMPRFRVCYKDESRLQRLIGRLIWPFNRTYCTQYTTVMFGRVYFPNRDWCARWGPEALYGILRHEAVHLSDMRRFAGLFQLSYLFALPSVFTMRAVWEWRGYLETMRVEAELHGYISDSLITHIAQRFTGSDYLYMCPFPGFVRRRLLKARERLLAEVAEAQAQAADGP
ncbi:MAG: hypothetical protein ACI9U2_002822 [Bradymonadia bacterium]|jgi:hypothetical protein